MSAKNPAAVALGRLRWQGFTAEERRALTQPARDARWAAKRQREEENEDGTNR